MTTTMSYAYDIRNLNDWGVPVEDELDDPDCPYGQRKGVAILMIGRSGSGKSSLARSILDAYSEYLDDDDPNIIYALNDRTSNCPYTKITWDKLPEVNNCALVVEDVIGASDKELKYLQELLNFGQHHKNISPIIIVAHTLTKNNIYPLMPSFHFIYVAAVKSIKKQLEEVLKFHGFDDDEKAKYVAVVQNCAEKFCHLRIDADTHEVLLTKAGQQAELKRDEERTKFKRSAKPDLATNAAKFLGDLPHPKKALLLFDLVHPKLPRGKLDPAFLTVDLRYARGDEVTLSLIDYLAALTDPDAEVEPEMLKFHKYLKTKGVKLPRVYVVNKKFW